MARNPARHLVGGCVHRAGDRNRVAGQAIIVISDPAAIRHVMVDNAKNYGMQPLRQRVLRPILRDGLLTAEGSYGSGHAGRWRRCSRRATPTGLATAIAAAFGAVRRRARR